MNNRVVTTILAGVVLITFSLTSSSCKIQKMAIKGDNTIPKSTLEIYCFDNGIKNRLRAATERYNKTNPGISFNLDAPKSPDDNLSSLQKKLNSNTEPVLFNFSGPAEMKILKLHLYDFKDFELTKSVLNNLTDEVTDKGSIYGLPVCIEGFGLIYNMEIFDAVKIKPESITSVDRLKDAAEKLNTKIHDKSLKENYPNLDTVFCQISDDNIGTSAPLFINEHGLYKNSRTLSESHYITLYEKSILKDILNLEKKYGMTSISDRTYYNDAYRISNEYSIILPASSRIINAIKEENTDASSKLGFLPIFDGRIIAGVPSYWGINKNANDSQITSALSFLEWLYTSDEGKIITTDVLYFTPAYSGYENITPSEALNRSISNFIENKRTIELVTGGLPNEMSTRYFSEKLLNYLQGKLSWSSLIKQTKKDFTRLQYK